MNFAISTEAFVLAGGKSSRMGEDKGLIPLQGKPIIAHVLEVLEKTGLLIKIIANDEAYKQFQYPVVSDVVQEKGPLGGLLTAYQNTRANQILLVSCDMPYIQEELVLKLVEEAGSQNIVVYHDEGRTHPLPGIYPVELRGDVEQRIAAKRLKMQDFISENKHTLVPSGDEKNALFFRNINTPEDLKEAEEQWRKLR